jgi:negative regulator of flagellin synthesis FlgM
MSYASGIGSLQQPINSISPSETKPGAPASNTDSDVASPVTAQPDRANFSSAGEIVSQALEGSDTRSAKVAALQQAIADGSYSVSSSDVADKIIQSLLG